MFLGRRFGTFGGIVISGLANFCIGVVTLRVRSAINLPDAVFSALAHHDTNVFGIEALVGVLKLFRGFKVVCIAHVPTIARRTVTDQEDLSTGAGPPQQVSSSRSSSKLNRTFLFRTRVYLGGMF